MTSYVQLQVRNSLTNNFMNFESYHNSSDEEDYDPRQIARNLVHPTLSQMFNTGTGKAMTGATRIGEYIF